MRRRSTLVAGLSAALLVTPLVAFGSAQLHAGPTDVGFAARALGWVQAAADTRDPLRYEVRMADPQRHEFQVALRFTGLTETTVELAMPKWNPGAYHLTNAHRNVRAVVARKLDAKGRVIEGAPLAINKLDENRWQVETEGGPFEVSYRVYCGSYTGIAGCYLDDAMGFFNGAHLFLAAVGHEQRPIELRVKELPGGGGTEVVSALPLRGSRGGVLWAENFDALIDSPVHVGEVDTVSFELGGKPIHLAMSAKGSWEADEMREGVRKITETAAAVFGPLPTALPFTDYTFIYHVLPDAGGGLEHRNSTVIGMDPWSFDSAADKQRLWLVTAHEFFHLWNVKRIRPAVLGPFDYQREVHTTMLWFSEGFTSYYAALILSRAGLMSETKTLAEFARRINGFADRPGRHLMSVEQSSWETWSRPDDGANSSYSYYDKGLAVGLLLDLHLREVSKGQRSTDTVFQELWQRWRDTGLGLRPSELEQVFVDQAGGDGSVGGDEVRAMFRDYVHGTAELDFDRYLAYAGYRIEAKVIGGGKAWIGVDASWRDGALSVRRVIPEMPGDAGGMANGDTILAVDGHAIERLEIYRKALGSLELDAPATFTVERMGRVLELEVVPTTSQALSYQVVELDEVSASQMLLRRTWLGLSD